MNRDQARQQSMLSEFKVLVRLMYESPSVSGVLASYEFADRCIRAGVPRSKLEAWSSRIAREHDAMSRASKLNRMASELIDGFLDVPDSYRTPVEEA